VGRPLEFDRPPAESIMAGDRNSSMPRTLEHLLQPFSFSEFYGSWYEKKPLLIQRRSPAWYEHLFTLDDIDEHIGERLLPAEALRVVRKGEELAPKDFMVGDAVDRDSLFSKFYDGYTIVLLAYARHNAATLRLCHDIERVFHAPVTMHVYLTPRNAQGFATHWDTHDTFILQFAGSKDWSVYDSPIALPSPQQHFYTEDWTPGEPTLRATLEPGDLLYLPRGYVHEGRSSDAMSGHVTIGVHTFTYADLLGQIANNASVDPWMRRSLPLDFRSAASGRKFLRHVHQFFEDADLPAYIERMHEDFAEDRLPDSAERLRDYVNLPSIGATSRFRTRSMVCHELRNGGNEVVLTFNKKTLTFPAAAAESIRFMIDAREFALSALPGSGEDNLGLCSTLVREGFLSIA
jgi:hypothetical protein